MRNMTFEEAASGALGTYAVQLAKSYGPEVAAVCSTKNIEFVKSLGADHVFDYTKKDPIKSRETSDGIFDAVGKTSFSKCKSPLKENGVYLNPVTEKNKG